MRTHHGGCFAIREKLTRRQEYVLLFFSFALPLLLWCLVSYVPFIYHPLIRVTDAGDSFLCAPGDLIERTAFERENKELTANGEKGMTGKRAIRPIFLLRMRLQNLLSRHFSPRRAGPATAGFIKASPTASGLCFSAF